MEFFIVVEVLPWGLIVLKREIKTMADDLIENERRN